MAVDTKRICNGTFGELWLNGDYVGECYKAQGKIEFNKAVLKQYAPALHKFMAFWSLVASFSSTIFIT